MQKKFKLTENRIRAIPFDRCQLKLTEFKIED